MRTGNSDWTRGNDAERTQLTVPPYSKNQIPSPHYRKSKCRKTTILQRLCNTTESPRIYCRPLTLNQCGEHDINEELMFCNHTGYVFHDLRGIESGGTKELEILCKFIQRNTSEMRLQSRLHAIWLGLFCVNDDNE